MFFQRGGLFVAVLAGGLFVTSHASAQVVGGVTLGFNQNQLGSPPAGVLLHRQYMQLYGLPTTFTQGQVTNGGGQGFGGFGGGYPGYGGYGGAGRFYGVNYQRNMAALQAYQAAAMQQYYASGYGMNPYVAPAAPATNFGSFSTSSSVSQPNFSQTSAGAKPGTPTFSGFGLTNTANPFLDLKKNEKEDK